MTFDERLHELAKHGWRADCVAEGKPVTMKIAGRDCCWIQGRFAGSDNTETAWMDVLDGGVMLHQRAGADFTWDEWLQRLALEPEVAKPVRQAKTLFE
jgi:hypothetical protein